MHHQIEADIAEYLRMCNLHFPLSSPSRDKGNCLCHEKVSLKENEPSLVFLKQCSR